jgi:CRISPR-associated protein Cmr6
MDYYRKPEVAPADWDDPNPVPFLSATGKYLIALSAPKDCEEWTASAFKILEHALEGEGIGAKSSSGYGRMELEVPPPDPDQAIGDELIRHVKAIPVNKLASELGQQASRLINLQIGERHKRRVAQAIVDRAADASKKQEKQFAGKFWYAELKKILGSEE